MLVLILNRLYRFGLQPLSTGHFIVVGSETNVDYIPSPRGPTYVYWQSTHMRKGKVFSPIVQKLPDHCKVLIVGCPVRSCHFCINCLIICLCSCFEQALYNLKPRLICIFGLPLDQIAAKAHTHQRSELILVLTVD